MAMKIYENKFFYITKCNEYPNVPGLFEIREKDLKWFSSKESINSLAIIEKTIRDELMNQGIELVGIYKEEYEDNKSRILIIPYDVRILKENNISPDLYQPYIIEYLKSFNEKNDKYQDLDKKIMIKLKGLNYE